MQQPGMQFAPPGAYGQPPQPQAGQPGAPFAFPGAGFGTPSATMQPVPQMPAPGGYQQPQGQPPGVQPVSVPNYVPSPGSSPYPQQQQNPAQAAQQAMVQRLTSIARSLEQAIPGYQVIFSLLGEASGGQKPVGSDTLLLKVKDAAFHHGAALGAIRRFLCGEMTPGALTNLAIQLHLLARVQSDLRPLLERVTMGTGADQRTPLNTISQALSAADYHLSQAAAAVQATVGQQMWESARAAAPTGAENAGT